MIDVTDENFYEELGKAGLEKPVTVAYFTAPWCGPCRMLKPTLERLEAENEGLTVLRIDVDTCPQLAIDFTIMSVPSLFFYSGGVQFDAVVGIKPKNVLEDIINPYLGD